MVSSRLRRAALLLLLAPLACDGTGPRPVPTTIRLTPSSLTLDDGQETIISATVLDQNGKEMTSLPPELSVTWSSADATIAGVAGGRVTGNRPGSTRITARSGEARAQAAVTVNAVATALNTISGDAQQGVAGTALRDSLVVRVVDRHGTGVSGVSVTWRVTAGGGSISPGQVSTDATGYARARWTLGESGDQLASASAGQLAAAGFTASIADPATAPAVEAVSPDPLIPGDTAVIRGRNFDADRTRNVVTVAGVRAEVLEAAATQLRVRVPSRTLLPCEATRAVPVSVEVGGLTATRDHPLQVAVGRSLAVGEAVTILTPEQVACNDLGSGRYLVSAFNTTASTGSQIGLRLRRPSSTGAELAARIEHIERAPRLRAPFEREASAPDAHHAILESSRSVLRTLAASRESTAPTGPLLAQAQAALPAVGDTLTFRVPIYGSTNNLCTNYKSVSARAVRVGTHAVVFEDLSAPFAGQMDARLEAVGREYDEVMHPLLLESFGDPLAYESHTDANGRIYMLFTPTVNNEFENVMGFVFSGDFATRTQCASSDQAEIFYARVPTDSASGYGSNTRDGWQRRIRGVVVHEVKHIVSFAERLARNGSAWEESWLEESTAGIAEELWARRVYGYAQDGNTGHRQSVYCEVRPSWPECEGSPLGVIGHFADIYDYTGAGGASTPLGKTRDGDYSFYGSGWSLVRWALDESGRPESEVLRELVQEPHLAGVANLVARTGRDFTSMLADWSLALAADDHPDFVPTRGELTFGSWNLRDVYAGLNADFPDIFTRVYAVQPVQLGVGASGEVSGVRGGAAVYFELPAAGAGTGVLEARGSGGHIPSDALGLAIVRVQ